MTTTDYDATRSSDQDEVTDSLEELNAKRSETIDQNTSEDDIDASETFELPGADLSEEELSVRVVPIQSDEFTCSGCFLVYHKNRIGRQTATETLCVDCA